ncbi:MAG TPA: C/D box methylation guide ribonucleoprotein complex aNOP56 subunit [Candidatus Lokiarchaeia archaeon]|nr:C/D box methylation guide ribonucleoprotein complex aNOP56 subunit [Candidatus Lokiarchaeia archaeon]
MNLYVVDTLFGSFLADESGTTKNVVSFGNDSPSILAKIDETKANPREIYEVLFQTMGINPDDAVIVESDSILVLLKEFLHCEVKVEVPSEGGQRLREALFSLLESEPWNLTQDAAIDMCREINLSLSRNGIKSISTQEDQQIKQAIETIDDIDKSVNLFSSRLREWYGLHFPELTDNLIADHLMFAKLILKLGKRENFTQETLQNDFKLQDPLTSTIVSNASASMGAEITDFDVGAIQTFARNIINIYELRDQMERYIDTMMAQTAPNLRAVVGSLVGARLISLAGGLRNLAMKPASTIQILGAEKALFRSLRSPTATSPKHGVIFQWPPLRTAKFWLRGKIARAIAGKLAIACKADFFTGAYIGDDLNNELRKRLADIEKKYPEPPKQEKRKPPVKRDRPYRGTGKKPFQKRRGPPGKYPPKKYRGGGGGGGKSYGGRNRPRPQGGNT